MVDQKKVLIVEDDSSIRKVLAEELSKLKINIIEADNGETAVNFALNEKPDLIILDVIMPKMHGIDMLRELEKEEWGRNVKVLLLTNFADDPRVIEAVKQERIDLLSKGETNLRNIVNTVKNKLGI